MKLLPKAAFYLLQVAIPITIGSVFWLNGDINLPYLQSPTVINDQISK